MNPKIKSINFDLLISEEGFSFKKYFLYSYFFKNLFSIYLLCILFDSIV